MNEADMYTKYLKDTNIINFSFLNNIEPYDGDKRLMINEVDIQKEIEDLSKEIDNIDIRSIRFDKWDFIMVFTVAILEVAGDFFISDNNNKNSLANKMSDKNCALGKYFNSIHESIDHKNNPLDFQGRFNFSENNSISFGGGDHRSRTFGHDLLFFPFAIYMLCNGKFIDGGYTDGVYKWVMSELNARGGEYVGMEFQEAVLAYLLHMFADFFSAKSLPIPGFSLLTHFPNRDIRKFSQQLYKDGLNLRNLAMGGIPVATSELIIWIYNSLKYKESDYSKELIKQKKEKMLLIVHTIATAVNLGKVIITKNPTSLNLVMIIRVVKLCWNVINSESKESQRSLEKVNMSVIKNKLELQQNLILLDKSIYYTKQLDKIFLESKEEFEIINSNRNIKLKNDFDELDKLMNELKSIEVGDKYGK